MADGEVVIDLNGNTADEILDLDVSAAGRIYARVSAVAPSQQRCGVYGLDISGSPIPGFGNQGGQSVDAQCVFGASFPKYCARAPLGLSWHLGT